MMPYLVVDTEYFDNGRRAVNRYPRKGGKGVRKAGKRAFSPACPAEQERAHGPETGFLKGGEPDGEPGREQETPSLRFVPPS